jgi:protein TonB
MNMHAHAIQGSRLASSALSGLELLRYSWRDRGLWAGAALTVMGAYAGAGYAISHWERAAEPYGGPPAAVMVEFAPELASPTKEHRDVAIGPQMTAQMASNPSNAENAPEKPQTQVVDAEGDAEEAVSAAEVPVEEVREDVQSMGEDPQAVEQAEEVQSTIPDVVEAEDPEVIVPEAVAAAAAPEAANIEQASVASPEAAPQIDAAPEMQEIVAKVAMAPAPVEEKAKVAPPTNDWKKKLVAYIERHKSYPAAARSKRQSGTVAVRFEIDGSGRVLNADVKKSSGYPILDEAAVSLIKRISPLPAPPAFYADSIIPLAWNLTFKLTK